MVLALKQTYRPTEQNWETRNTFIHLLSIDLWEGCQEYKMGREESLNKWWWGNCISTCKNNETRPLSYRYTKIYSKQIKDLNVRLETVTHLKENRGSRLFDTGLSNNFLDVTLQARKQKQKKPNGTSWNSKAFVKWRKLSTKWKSCLLNVRRYCIGNHTSD